MKTVQNMMALRKGKFALRKGMSSCTATGRYMILMKTVFSLIHSPGRLYHPPQPKNVCEVGF